MYVYSIPPLDYGWHNLPTIGHFSKGIRDAAEKLGWEGDVVGSIRSFYLPFDAGFKQGYVWKQRNNGTTFVASPIRLEYLDSICSGSAWCEASQ